MKRISIYAFALLAIFASCSKAEIEAPEENGQAGPDIEVEDGQIICSIPQTKTALDDDLNAIWSEDDEIMVLGEGTQTAKYKFSSFATDDKKSAVFENVDPKVTGNRTAIYPASTYVAESYDGEKAKISLGGVEELNMPVGAVSSVLSSSTGVSALPLVSTPSEDNLTFSNLFGGIMFRPYDYMGMGVNIQKLSVASTDGRAIGGVATIDIETGKIISFEGTDTELTFKCSNTNITSKKGFVAYLPAGEYPGLVITAIDNLGRKFPVTTKAMTINAGLVKKLAELPLTIWYGNTNCIVVAPGTTSVEIDATPHFTWRSDYKAEATADNVIRVENGNMSGLGGGATVLWQQEEGSTLTDLTATNTTDGPIVNGALTIDRRLQEGKTIITVPLSGKKGNAVIALRSVLSGTPVVWSFHIWVSEINDIQCTSSSLGSYYILDRNLGATTCVGKDQDPTGYPNSYGLYYQWGRKDPFPKCLSTDLGASSNTYYFKSDLLNVAEKNTVMPNINYSIQNPETRIGYKAGNAAHWEYYEGNTSEFNTALWGYPTTKGSGSDAYKVKESETVKTVYDPCPAGYRVPATGYLHNLASGGKGSQKVMDQSGYYLSTGAGVNTFIPANGIIRSIAYKGASSSEYSLSYPTRRGALWSSVPRSPKSQGAYCFWYNDSSVDASSSTHLGGIVNSTAQAMPVRCIKE